MDYKMAAAGNEQNPQNKSVCESPERRPVEFYEEVLGYLLSFTQAELSAKDQALWIQRLSTVPPWKLKRLDEFTSPFINEVWKFLDDLKQEPETFKALPEPPQTSRSVQVARDFNEHIQAVVKMIGDTSVNREARLIFEWESFKRLDRKYLHLNVIEQIRCEKRFQGMG